MLTLQKFKKIVNILRAVGQDPKEHKEISQIDLALENIDPVE